MISFAEAAYSIRGALRIARGDIGGLDHFDDSHERFWRSFWAAAYAAPLIVVIYLVNDLPQPPKSWARYFLVNGLTYVIAFFLWPLVMVFVSRWLDREARFCRYIMTYNWAQVVGTGFHLVILLIAVGMFPGKSAQVLIVFAYLVVLFYEWFITRLALDVTGLQAAGIVVLNVVVAIFLAVATGRLAIS